MVKKSTQTGSKLTSLFEIRLKNLTNDVLIVKGSENDASSVFLSGNIVLSLKEPMTVKGITLRLYATLNLHWIDNVVNSKGGPATRPNKFQKKLFEYNFDSTEFKSKIKNIQYGVDSSGTPSGQLGSTSSTSRPLLSKTNSSASLKSFGALRSKSSSSLHNVFSSSSSHSRSSTNLASISNSSSLPVGNHEIPFSAILPGSIPESVEGLPHGLVVYKLEAILERGKFQNSLCTTKHLRVIRTLTTDAVELSETVAVDNTWPKKVEYSLNVPQKAIALGSNIPISFMLVPLLKGLRLGKITIDLVENYSLAGYFPPVHSGERVIASKKIEAPNENDPNFQHDRWEITTFLRVPDRLSKCTQDCDISQHMKVKHKLKFGIGLVNPDNHVSELRASLPVQLFISPFITIRARHDAAEISETNSLNDIESNNDDQDSDGNPEDDDVLFASNAIGSSTSLNQYNENGNAIDPGLISGGSSTTSFNGIIAPPVYERHVLDRLWMDISPIDSPINSGRNSGINSGRTSGSQTPQPDEMFGLLRSPIDGHKLSENLRQLAMQQTGSNTIGSRAVFNFDEDTDHQNSNHLPPTASALSLALNRAGIASPPMHLSRTTSSNVISPESMIRVPSYDEAVRSDTNEEVLSPAYEPPSPGSHVNMEEVSRILEEQKRRNGTAYSGKSIKSISPNISRNISHSSLLGSSGSISRTNSFKGVNSESPVAIPLTPLAPALIHSQSLDNYTSVSQLSSSASERTKLALPSKSTSSISLNNMAFLKKHK